MRSPLGGWLGGLLYNKNGVDNLLEASAKRTKTSVQREVSHKEPGAKSGSLT